METDLFRFMLVHPFINANGLARRYRVSDFLEWVELQRARSCDIFYSLLKGEVLISQTL